MTIKTELRRRPQIDGSFLPPTISPLLRRLYASRGVTTAEQLEKGAKGLLGYQSLVGIEPGVELLVQALHERKRIVIVGDFDADGATSTALSVLALRNMGFPSVKYLVPNRFEDGYGLSPEVVEQAAELGVDLIVTVDNGISSHAGVDCAHDKGIQVLVTDHHL